MLHNFMSYSLYVCLMIMIVFTSNIIAEDYLFIDDGENHFFDESIGDIMIDDNSTLASSLTLGKSGSVRYSVHVKGSGMFTNLGGTIGSHICATDNSHIIMTDGLVGNDIDLSGSSQATIYGGSIDHFHIFDDAEAEIYGGHIRKVSNVNRGHTTFYGNFGIQPGEYFHTNDNKLYTTYYLNGYFSNGDVADCTILVHQNGSFTVAVPEPGSLVLLGLGGFIIRRRRG